MKNKHRTVSSRVAGAMVPAVMFLLLLVPLSGVSAHSLYIQSTRYAADKGKSLPLFFCYGHYVPAADGIRGKKLKKVQITAPDGTVSDITVRDETSLHSYMVDYDIPGTWILTVETTPGYFTMYTDKKGRDRHAIKPMDHVRDKALLAYERSKQIVSDQYGTRNFLYRTLQKNISCLLEMHDTAA